MAIIKCSVCNAERVASAKICHKCGAKSEAKGLNIKGVAITFVIAILLFSYLIRNSSNQEGGAASSQDITTKVAVSSPSPVACDSSTRLTGGTYRPKGSGISVRALPDVNSPKLINEKATAVLHEINYITLDDTVQVVEECTKGEWSWVRVVDPASLADSHKGWIQSEFLSKDSSVKGDGYDVKISSSALIPYKKNDGYEQFESRFMEIEKLRRKAAERTIDIGACDFVVSADLSVINSMEDNLQFWVECGNGVRAKFNESQLR